MNKIDNLQTNTEIYMKKCIVNFQENIDKIYIGRVAPKILSGIQVECYGILTSLIQLTNISVKNSYTLIVTVFDKKLVKSVEKAIISAKLDLTLICYGNVLHITLPILTEERRLFLKKMVNSEAEKSKISIRNIRRIMNEKSKVLFKKKEISEDEEYFFQNDIQKLTNIYIKKVDCITNKKVLELMKF